MNRRASMVLARGASRALGLVGVLLIASAAALSGCAVGTESAPPEDDAVAASQDQLEIAIDVGAGDFDPGGANADDPGGDQGGPEPTPWRGGDQAQGSGPIPPHDVTTQRTITPGADQH